MSGRREPAGRRRPAVGRAAVLLAGGLIATTALAQPPNDSPHRAPPVQPVRLEHGSALAPFHRRLTALARGEADRVRVLHWGDSNVAAGLFPSVAREALQARYGDGGDGYLLPRGHGSWPRGEVRISTSGRWASRRRGFGNDFGPSDGLWGLAGVAVEPVTPGASIRLRIPPDDGPRRIEVHLLARRIPGAVEVEVDRVDVTRVRSAGARQRLRRSRFELDRRQHRVVVRHAEGRPRLLGVVVERERGVTYDVLGINGHRASAILHWDPQLLEEQLQGRLPHLVVLSYGGNEALDPLLSMERYEEQLRAAVGKVRDLTPGAACLLVGPFPSCQEHGPRMAEVTEVQRRVAPEAGCAFWDPSMLAGGHGRLCRTWGRFGGMVSADRLHLGPDGYRVVGRQFVRALLPPGTP
ncbi:MAG: GDSL-type esterase/lipase family protein [Sandaracinaceae bacterium]